MLTVYRAELPRTLALVVALSLAVPATSLVVREFHSTDSPITIIANLNRKPHEATITPMRESRHTPPIANLIDRVGRVE